MTENVTGYNSTLAYGAATGTSLPAPGSDVYTEIPDIESLTPPSAERQKEERYVLSQKSAKKFVGSITYTAVSGNMLRAFDSAAHDQLENDANAASAVRRNWRIVKPNAGGEINYFAGYCSKFQYGEITNQGVMTVTFEIEVDGDVTIVR